MYVYVCIYICTYIYTCMYIYMYIYIYRQEECHTSICTYYIYIGLIILSHTTMYNYYIYIQVCTQLILLCIYTIYIYVGRVGASWCELALLPNAHSTIYIQVQGLGFRLRSWRFFRTLILLYIHIGCRSSYYSVYILYVQAVRVGASWHFF